MGVPYLLSELLRADSTGNISTNLTGELKNQPPYEGSDGVLSEFYPIERVEKRWL